MKKSDSAHPISKGHFGYDLSNSFLQNQSNNFDQKGYQHSKKSVNNNSNNVINPYLTNSKDSNSSIESNENNGIDLLTQNKTLKFNNGNNNTNIVNNIKKHPYNEQELNDDADDEKDSISNEISSSVYSNSNSNLNSNKPNDVAYTKPNNLFEFETITKSLLNQIKITRDEAFNNQALAQKLSEALSILNQERAVDQSQINDEFAKKFKEISLIYDNKIMDLERKNSSQLLRMKELEDVFNNIQKYQSNIYQEKLKGMETQIQNLKNELNETKQNYQLLEQWVLTLFKVIGERANTWCNHQFIITTKEISKCLKPPVKRSELQSLYRYLMEFLYLNEIDQTETSKEI